MTRVLASGYTFPEAPCVLSDGRLAFSDVVGGGVFALAEDGSVSTLVERRRGVGGLVAHADGGVVMTGRDLRLVALDGSQRLVLDAPEGIAGFNDLAATPDGDLLVGALAWNAMAGEQPAPSFVWLVGASGVVAEWTGLVWPNGISMLPDGERFVVNDYQDGRVLSGSLSSAGELEVLARVPAGSADGLAVDAEGGVWVALGPAGSMARLEPRGSPAQPGPGAWENRVDLPATFVTSASFTSHTRLAVTAAGAPDGGVVLEVEVDVPGMELPLARG